MTVIQNQGLLTRLKRWANLVNFSSRQRDGADVPSFSKPFYCHCRVLYKVAGLQCNFWVCGRNPAVWPFKWNLSGRTFTWYYLFVCLFLLLLFNFWVFSKMKFGNFVECWLRPFSAANHFIVYNFCALFCFVFIFILFFPGIYFNSSAEHFNISLLCPAPLYYNFKLMILAGTHIANTKTSDFKVCPLSLSEIR